MTQVLSSVVIEHPRNASQFSAAIRSAPFLLQCGDSLEGLCRHSQANLDALLIAGKEAISLGQAAMRDDGEGSGCGRPFGGRRSKRPTHRG